MTGKAVLFLRVAAAAAVLVLGGCGGGSAGSASGPGPTSTSPETAVPAPPTVALSASSYSVAQGDGTVQVQVERSGPSAAAVSVDFATNDDSAVAGTDYTDVNGTLQWAENDATPKTISIPVSNATLYSGDKAFGVVLSNPSASVNLGSPGTATVTISGGATGSVGALQLSSS